MSHQATDMDKNYQVYLEHLNKIISIKYPQYSSRPLSVSAQTLTLSEQFFRKITLSGMYSKKIKKFESPIFKKKKK